MGSLDAMYSQWRRDNSRFASSFTYAIYGHPKFGKKARALTELLYRICYVLSTVGGDGTSTKAQGSLKFPW